MKNIRQATTDDFYFNEIQVANLVDVYREPVLHGKSIGSVLLNYVISKYDVNYLWALEKNVRAISFCERHGFRVTDDKKFEEGTTEYLVRLER